MAVTREQARDRLIVALDISERAELLSLADTLRGRVGLVKIGLEAFTAHGPALVNEVRGLGLEVFLDLKLHDIPNTVERAAANCARLGVTMFTVHAAGGGTMLAAAASGAATGAPPGVAPPKVLAVTVLTSLDDTALAGLNMPGPIGDRVMAWAELAAVSGCGGVVCSPLEIAALRSRLARGFLLVTPGIRPAGGLRGDQKRVATPASAVADGSDFIVVGRPITAAVDPAAAADAIVDELHGALNPVA